MSRVFRLFLILLGFSIFSFRLYAAEVNPLSFVGLKYKADPLEVRIDSRYDLTFKKDVGLILTLVTYMDDRGVRQMIWLEKSFSNNGHEVLDVVDLSSIPGFRYGSITSDCRILSSEKIRPDDSIWAVNRNGDGWLASLGAWRIDPVKNKFQPINAASVECHYFGGDGDEGDYWK